MDTLAEFRSAFSSVYQAAKVSFWQLAVSALLQSHVQFAHSGHGHYYNELCQPDLLVVTIFAVVLSR